ncbi:CsbD family protein [Nocardia tengchongensis]|uniref:CsbD family protein n=2 Tax=Nocardia tengchongensis TaxID=2055889 RepID=A0ABX8CZ81_9NOCA|nr:CsbD family protein [Nocardia tengchongensis]QVI25138.1 CsbD family protein [Nocardia tengchongensis]
MSEHDKSGKQEGAERAVEGVKAKDTAAIVAGHEDRLEEGRGHQDKAQSQRETAMKEAQAQQERATAELDEQRQRSHQGG